MRRSSRSEDLKLRSWSGELQADRGNLIFTRQPLPWPVRVLPVGEGVTLIQVWSFDSCIRIDITTKLRLYFCGPQGITRLYLLACGLFFAWVWTEMSQTQWNNHLGARWRHIPLWIYLNQEKRERESRHWHLFNIPVSCSLPSDSLYTCICLFAYLLPLCTHQASKNWVICRFCSLLYLHFYNISACKGSTLNNPFFWTHE